MTKKKRLFIILAIVLAALIAVGVVLAVIFTRNSAPETPGGTQGGNEQPGGTQGGGTQGGNEQPGGTQGGGTQGGGTQGGGTQGGGTQGGGTQGGGTQGGGTQGGGTEHTHDMTKHEKQEPTCTAEGTITYWHCSGCQKDYLDPDGNTEAGDLTIPKLKHDMTEHEKQDPTCTAEGTVAYWHCSGCNKNYLDEEGNQEAGDLTIPKLDHDMTKHEKQDPTCTAEGTVAYWHCSGCNKNYLDEEGTTEAGDLTIEKLEHTPEEYIELQPTCDVPGKKYQRCSVCHTPLSGEEEISVLGHDWGDWVYNNDAKCEMDGTETKRCKRVGCVASETRTKEGSALQHDYDENGKCRRDGCGDTNGPKTPSSGGSISQGDKVIFGSYPQTEVQDSALKSTLTAQAGTLPTEQSAGKWTDYGYYYGTDNIGSEAVHSYMWYQDISYGGEKYRGVYFTSYRSYSTSDSSSASNSWQDDNGYDVGTVYWFRYEPIVWRVLEQKNDTALLMANIILDSQQYYHNISTRGSSKPIYPNNYAESDIRAWLKDTFYETAFDEYAKSFIETTEVDNSASSTQSSNNSYACENTQDKVFLLSYQDVLNPSYGFNWSDLTHDTARQLKSTDYAKSQGVWQSTDSRYRGNSWWWLRSPTLGSGNGAYTVGHEGGAYSSSGVNTTYGGVVPALRIKLSESSTPETPAGDPVWKDDHTVLFGCYPQTKVGGELKNKLTAQAGRLPTEDNSGKWTDYGYYIDGSVQSYMWYQDLSYGGEKYRGVYFTSYRPNSTTNSSSADNSCQDDNGYNINTVYWFRYEPIEWRVLEQKDGTALLMANIILDSQAYQNEYEYQQNDKYWQDGKYYTHSNGAPAGTYANNYKYSTIRSWLRDTFYETAFDEYAKSFIETTEVENSASSTQSSSNPYACESTQDKVFLLSYRDVLNASYGFSSSYSSYDTARQLKSTDYAKSQGVYVDNSGSYAGNGWWWLRSPDDYNNGNANYVNYGGYANDHLHYVHIAFGGVVPALRIKL